MNLESNEPIEPQADEVKPKGNQMVSINRPWYALGSQSKPAKVNRQLKSKLFKRFLLLAVVGVVLSVTATNFNDKITPLANGGIQYPPTLAALAGGCTGIAEWKNLPSDEIGWVPQGPGAFLWRTLPPVSGNFNKTPWKVSGYVDPADKVQPNVSGTLADLYRGWTIIWMAQTPQEGSLVNLKDWAQTTIQNGGPVLVAKWPIPQASSWPRGRNVVFVSWDYWEACALFDSEAFAEFKATASKVKAPGLGLSMNETGPKAKVQTAELARLQLQLQQLQAGRKPAASPKK